MSPACHRPAAEVAARAATDKRKADVENAQHQIAALRNAMGQQEAAVAALLSENTDRAREAAQEALDGAAAATAALEEPAAARDCGHDARTVLAWLSQEGGRRWRTSESQHHRSM
jgi:molybdopterin/thiamine biosynthesis adenylyltransferase